MMKIPTSLVFVFMVVLSSLSLTKAYAGRIMNKDAPEAAIEIMKLDGMVHVSVTWGNHFNETIMTESELNQTLNYKKKSFRKNVIITSDNYGWFYASEYVFGLDRPYSITAERVRDVSYGDFGLDDLVLTPITAGLETVILPISGTIAIIKNIYTNRDASIVMQAIEKESDTRVGHNRFLRILYHLNMIPTKRW